MALQRTPPNKFSSNPDIPLSTDTEILYVNPRKRKQPDVEDAIALLEKKFEQQLLMWNEKIAQSITGGITAAVNSALAGEMSKLSATLSDINTNIQKLNADNVRINNALTETNLRLTDMEKSLNFSAERQDLFDNKIKALEDKISPTIVLSTQLQALENKVADLEQQARECNIEICNVPERRNENLVHILESIGNEINHPIRISDITSVHRVPHADQKNPRPKNIIAKLTSRLLRDNFISAYRTGKGLDTTKLSITGSPHKIFVNEHLTLKKKHLFRQCREAARKYEYKYVWIKHGTILARKSDTAAVIAIRSPQDISKII
ncbi:uncharacterized protein LOC113225976 [Hyposmocoma kahamanoa]|uniref:uncharacterized protein LOC113225976 n=1 Tax=Hyposmocoma kahamanoa TaxID=1477025 RepID=UPI000E6D7DB6|nr:uncharacterized protein LOC113225976 [Hyposmocoma kahamanoa]